MRQLCVTMILMATALSLLMSVAEAKPAGASGKSTHAAVAKAESQTDPATEPVPAPDTGWKGSIGGIVVGLGGGRLASRLGVDPAWLGLFCAVIILVVATVLFRVVVRLIAKPVSRWMLRMRHGRAIYAGDYLNSIMSDVAGHVEPNMKPLEGQGKSAAAGQAGFDMPDVLRSAKTCFMRLQAAWDHADLKDIRAFTTAELYAAFEAQIQERMQERLQERGDARNHTAVESLDAVLLKFEGSSAECEASVKFTGMIKEENQVATPFLEIWNLAKTASNADEWILLDIQQFA